jgi:hypothetical protein
VIVSRAETAEEWLRRSQATRFPGQDMRARFVMRIDRANGTRLRRTGVSLRRTRSDGLADRLFVVRSPTSLAGLALLSLDQPAKPASQWLYLPTYRRARRVALHGTGDAYIGSDFIYADLGSVQVEAGRHSLKGSTEVEGRACVVVDTINEDPSLPYHRYVSMLDRENVLPLRVEYYDEDSRMTRVLSLEKITEIQGWLTPLKISMTNKLDGGRSIIKLEDVQYDVSLEPSLFTVENLEKAESDQ